MKKRRSGLISIIIFVVGFALAFFIGSCRLEKQRQVMQSEIDKTERRADLLQRRYAEQKATSERLQRIKVSLEGQKSTLKTELDGVNEKLTSLIKEYDDLKNIQEKDAEKLAGCKKDTKRLITENKTLTEKLEEKKALLAKTIKEYEELIAKTERERDRKYGEMNSAIRSLESRLSGCTQKNARLCIIAEELLDRCEDKGIVSTILAKEPVTQIKKVELENLAMEYREAIEKQRERIRDQ